MRNRKTYILVALLLIAAVAMLARGRRLRERGGGRRRRHRQPDGDRAPAAARSQGPPPSAPQAILGKAPSGLAATIVERGTVIVSTDANYAPQSSIDQATGDLVGFDIDVAKAMAETLGLTAGVQDGGLGDGHPRPADRQVGRLHRLHDDHARA